MTEISSRNLQWFERLNAVIPWGSSTCSKKARYPPDEPTVIVRGKGCRVWDADGREYIDFRNSLGPVTLGYAYPAVDEAIRAQLENGIIFGYPHPLEAEVAEEVHACVPCAERVRFLKTGGEAVAACIRLARCHTGRDHVVQIGYNGWLNSLSSGGRTLPGTSSPAVPPGVPAALSALHHSANWNDPARIERLFTEREGRIAAVVVAADYGTLEAGKTFYPFLRALTSRHGAVLIYDEIVTGFRIARAGVQEYFGVVPDLAVFAKGIANGMPLSVYAGRAEIMDKLHTAVVSSTYGGETLSLAAARATLNVYAREDVIGHLWRVGARFADGFNRLLERFGLPVRIQSRSPIAFLGYAPEAPADLRERLMRAIARHGVSLYNGGYVNYSHQEADIDEALARIEQGLREL